MKIAFDVKGTIEGPKGKFVLGMLKMFQDAGHEVIVWSNAYGYAVDAVRDHELDAEAHLKWSKGSVGNWRKSIAQERGRKRGVKVFGNKDLQGRLHGPQPVFNDGAEIYNHGVLEFMDDGNGNQFDINDPDDDEGDFT